MYIYEPLMRSVREDLELRFPEHVIVFDVLFESKGGPVEWHCDYESLGPFVVSDSLVAIREHHFLSVHFNLTPEGGSLTTLDWVWISWLHYIVISWFGIFGWCHTVVVCVTRPLFRVFGHVCDNTPCVGNAFDNMRLHSVSGGKPRLSFVVRLAKRGRVFVTQGSVLRGIERSAACVAFQPLLERLTHEERLDVSDVSNVLRSEVGNIPGSERERWSRE